MKRTTVIRTYAVAFMLAMAPIAHESFTEPIRTEAPQEIQNALYENVPKVLPGPPPRAVGVREGNALVYLRIPRFGKNWIWVASEGTSLDMLNNGPGHFVNSALPGEKGNTAYAAHRAGYGDPFINFDLLVPGDKIVVAQNGAEWTYIVLFEPRIIEPTDGWVAKRTKRDESVWGRPRLTLTTCWPKYGSEKRMYVRAILEES